ncbi:MAG: hypothetical protein COB12_10725 [Flavobacterium sp.]|nr:MAG: hypothetical protein COB12_10725 [Flavobacterium sp.]
MNIKIAVVFLIAFSFSMQSQVNSWFYLRAKNESFNPVFKEEGEKLIYTGTNSKLKSILNKYTILEFKKTFRNARKKNLKKTFFVVTNDDDLLNDLLTNASNIFEFGEIILEEDKKIFEPNDYGLTSTLGDNKGLQVNLDYLDFLNLPKAWYYTTGSKDVLIGISDARIDTTNNEFANKTTVLKESTISRGHGSGVAVVAAGQGDNEYGIVGVCYNCSILSTNYGDFKNMKQLIELSNAGAKVINCSWVGTKYYQTAQDVINEITSNGTLIVAGAGNRDWRNTKGSLYYYPASYDNVISVSAAMHRYEDVYDNIQISEKGSKYAANIRYFLGRTVGFKDKENLKDPYIYQASTTTLNDKIDILTPAVDLFKFSQFVMYNKMEYTVEATSSTAPFVTGTIGLMYSMNPCFPLNEVESVIKLTATNIGHIKQNKPFEGNYGAGMLNVGNAIEMVYDLYTKGETATIENQNFTRWDFKLTSLSEKVLIQNQKFTESSTLNLTAKNSIVIGKNTVLKPNIEGSIILKIDPTLEKECDLVLREGFPNNKYYHPEK